MSVCLSVQAITFEPLHIETPILVCRYIFTISGTDLSIKVFGSRSYKKNDDFTYFNILILCVWLHVINMVKVTHQGQGSHQGQSENIFPLSNLCKILFINYINPLYVASSIYFWSHDGLPTH